MDEKFREYVRKNYSRQLNAMMWDLSEKFNGKKSVAVTSSEGVVMIRLHQI